MAEEMVLIPKLRYERLLSVYKNDSKLPPNGPTSPVKTPPGDGDHVKAASPKRHSEGKLEGKSEGSDESKAHDDDKDPSKSPSKVPKEQPVGGSGFSEKKNEKSPQLTGPPTTTDDSNGLAAKKLKVDSILNEIPSKYRVKAKRILAYIDSKGGSIINWNGRGRLIYKKMVINGSNIAKLVEYLILNKGKKVIGFNLFQKGLAKINMPDSLLLPQETKKDVNGDKKKPAKVNEDVNGDKLLQKKWLSY
jgi:hypothetical protein